MADWVAVAVASLALIVSIVAVRESRRTQKFQILLDLQKEYRSPEFYNAVMSMWSYYEAGGASEAERASTWVNRYMTAYDQHRALLLGSKESDRLSIIRDSLDNQRRLLSHFFSQMGVMYCSSTLPRHLLFEQWSAGTLSIVPRLLIPIENALREKFGSQNPPIDAHHHMLKLFAAAQIHERHRQLKGIRGLCLWLGCALSYIGLWCKNPSKHADHRIESGPPEAS